MECCFSHIRTNNIVYSRFEIKKNFPILLTKYNSPLWAYSSGADIVIKSQKGLVAVSVVVTVFNSTFDQTVHPWRPFWFKNFFFIFFNWHIQWILVTPLTIPSLDFSDVKHWANNIFVIVLEESEVFDEILIASYHQITHWVRLSFKSAAGVWEVLHSIITASGHIKI